jgi:hypothetical protein
MKQKLDHFCQWCSNLLARPFFHDTRTTMWLWMLLAVVSALTKMHRCNNFIIFRQSF